MLPLLRGFNDTRLIWRADAGKTSVSMAAAAAAAANRQQEDAQEFLSFLLDSRAPGAAASEGARQRGARRCCQRRRGSGRGGRRGVADGGPQQEAHGCDARHHLPPGEPDHFRHTPGLPMVQGHFTGQVRVSISVCEAPLWAISCQRQPFRADVLSELQGKLGPACKV